MRDPEEWVRDLLELKEHADRARRSAQARWDEAWRLYNNVYDFSAKASWQAKNYVPRVSMTIEMAASLVRRAMLDANEWFRYEGTTETSRRMAPYLEKLAYYYLDRLRFADSFVPPLKGGLVGSMIVLKPHLAPYVLAEETPEDRERRDRGEAVHREVLEGPAITISYPDPYNIWLDWTGRNLFVIEEEEMDLPMAWDLADMGVLDGDVLRKVAVEDWVESEKETREEQRRQQAPAGRPSFRRVVKLTHFWGSLPHRDGRWAIRNGHFVIANDKYLIRPPMDNPYDHGQLPYVIGSPFRRPFSVYHKGLVEDVVGLQRAMTELLNLALDGALFAGIKAFEVDLDQIEDPQQILNGIYPGKVFTKRAGGQTTQMIRDISIQGISRDVLAVYNLIGVEYQNSTAVTEFISGALSTSPGRTATEVVTKQQQGMGIFGEMARNLEGTVLEPMLEQLAHLIVQYHDDFTSQEVVDILGEDMAFELMLSDVEVRRSRFEPGRIRVRASGISSLLNRTEEIQKINALLQSLGQFGPMLQTIMQEIDVPYFFSGIFKRLVRAYGWNERDLIRPATSPPPEAAALPARAAGPEEGEAAPPPVEQTMAQIQKIRDIIASGGVAPSPASQGVR